MQIGYLYALDFPFKNFSKLTKHAETIRNHQNRFWLWLNIVWETHKLARYQSREFSCYILKHTRKLTTSASRSYYSFPARDWSLVFDPEKATFSVSSEHKTTYKRPGSYSPPYSLPSLWKIRKRLSQLSPFDHATWQHTRESPRHVRESARIYDVRMAQFVLKIEKLSHIIRCARIPRLTVSVPDYGSWSSQYIFQLIGNWKIYYDDHSSLSSTTAVQKSTYKRPAYGLRPRLWLLRELNINLTLCGRGRLEIVWSGCVQKASRDGYLACLC